MLTTAAALTMFAACITAGQVTASAQTTPRPVTNKYSMKLQQKADGTWELQRAERYARIVNLDEIDSLLVPFTLERKRLSSKDYKGVETKHYIYKSENG